MQGRISVRPFFNYLFQVPQIHLPMQYTIEAIGFVSSPYTQKFGIPRQPDLVPAALVCIHLNRRFTADSVRGLDGFDYIWLHFIFHDAVDEGWAQLVRPPRLGGKQKAGVFATRSPHRPNHLGLSLLKLERIETDGGVRLYCRGADLLDGTPVVDIKPYIPFVEAQPDARAGFAPTAPVLLHVQWLPESGVAELANDVRDLIEQSIAQDPRPAYQDIPERIYGMRLADVDVKFRIEQNVATILAVEQLVA